MTSQTTSEAAARATAMATTPAALTAVTITGTISDPEGFPLPGITVALAEQGPDESPYVGSTTTDDAGAYRFTRLRAAVGDSYRVEATDDSGSHVSTCSTVEVKSGAMTKHHATMSIAGHIQGRVTSHEGGAPDQPATHVCVTAESESAVHAVHVSAMGTFRIGGLSAGDYLLAFHDTDITGDEARPRSMWVTVTPGRATTIDDQVLTHPTGTTP
ncbi:carboxypeptidase-like regulatory domain-containing protein [Aeromicrobium sp.]|uniref:carboxypeptidase-like regulatory domain-containing protein n=1 Tax=Aeromicrobium sp. TaxID=1871063 RepID=UPI0030C2E632